MSRTNLKFNQIRKRDGRVVDFSQSKITEAIFKAFLARGKEDKSLAEQVSNKVVGILNRRFEGKIPQVEQIQDIVVEALAKNGHKKVAESYDLYRQKRREIRDAKWWLLSQNVKTKISPNALRVLESRYLKKDGQEKIIETPQQLFQRVAANIASAETFFKPSISDDELFDIGKEFYRMMASLEFLPNSPTLMNAGGVLQQLSACFVLDVGDSMEEIFEAIKNAAIIHKSGGGTGFSFSKLRPKKDLVKSTQGQSSGPLSFMSVFNAATEVVKQAGKRRGANMGILRIDHPDIMEFITAKLEEGVLNNFNLSVAITDEFMEAVKKNKKYDLINPRTGQVAKKIDANKVFDLIVHYAWENGEPGVIFIDRINRDNPTPKLGEIESTNPCIVGDTLVGVADGRNYVSIKQLAKEGKDVPVYSYGDGKIQVRMGRNPRKTRKNVPVWKVVLDDGSHIIATEDHKFRDRNNKEIKLKDLKLGISLMPFNKYQNIITGEWQVVQSSLGYKENESTMIKEFSKGAEIKQSSYGSKILLNTGSISEFYNHKVKSIEFYGREDVYNITVDEFHTVVYITKPKAKTKISKKSLISGIVTGNCGEQPLLGQESCNLGSINLGKMVMEKSKRAKNLTVDWDKLKETVHNAVHFLDNVIDVNRYPLPEIEKMTKGNRKIGLGVMGWADMLIMLNIPYNSLRAFRLAEKIMKFIQEEGQKASVELAEERGVFPNFMSSVYNESAMPRVRNATVTTIAPTGTISIIAGASSAIEPLFAIAFVRKHVLGGQELVEVNPLFEEIAKERGFWSKELIEEVSVKGSLQDIKSVPADVKKVFVTALEIGPEDHIKMQAAFQKYVDNATSKTINFPFKASEAQVKKAYLLAYKLGCKGVTLYRNESRKQQVLNINNNKGQKKSSIDSGKKIPEKDVSPELRDPSPNIPDLPPGSCPTCNI